MSDPKNITEDDEDIVAVETDTIPQQDQEDDSDDKDVDNSEDDDDGEDSRLADDDEDGEDDSGKTSANRKRRQKRRETQKRAKEAAQRELRMLRQQNADLMRRVSAVEGRVSTDDANSLDARLAQAEQHAKQAELIIAKATEAGNGEDVVTAMRLREQAQAEARQLQYEKQQMEQRKRQLSAPDQRVVNYAAEWMKANPWYDPQGRDRDSALTKNIDNALAAEGYDPRTREYWEELTDRVADAFGEAQAAAQPKKRKAPPTGTTREHAPVSTKKEVYVTPERKQAMIEAGVWDDPELRKRYLKAYQAYDTGSAR